MEEAWEGSSEEVTKRRSQRAKVWRGQCFRQGDCRCTDSLVGIKACLGITYANVTAVEGVRGRGAQGELGGVGTGPLDQLSEPWLFLKVVLPGARPIPAGAGT